MSIEMLMDPLGTSVQCLETLFFMTTFIAPTLESNGTIQPLISFKKSIEHKATESKNSLQKIYARFYQINQNPKQLVETKNQDWLT